MRSGRFPERLERRRVAIFLGVTFVVSWSVGGVVVALSTLGIGEGGLGALLQGALLTLGFMWGPAVGHVVARTVTDEGWRGSGDGSDHPGDPAQSSSETFLRPRIRDGWPYYLAGWLLPAVLTLLGAGIYFAAFPEQFGGLAPLREALAAGEAETGQPVGLSPAVLLAVTLVSALTIAIPINAVGAFGEEFGWRAYLLPKLLALGPRRGLVVLGVVWGVWHWPLTAIGHNYGLDYPFAPVPGMLAILWFTTVVGVVLAWLTLRSGSVWPAVIAHAALNAIAGVGIQVASGDPNLLLGPTPAGLLGSIPFALLAGWILIDPDRIAPASGGSTDDDRDPGAAAPAATVDAPGASGSAAAVPESDDEG